MTDAGAPSVAAPAGGVNASGQSIDKAPGSIVPAYNANAGLQTPGAMGGNALIVTSNASRAVTTGNIGKLQAATNPNPTTTANSNPTNSKDSNPSGTTININGSTAPTGSGSSAPTGGLTSDQMQAAGITDSTGWTKDPTSGLFTPPKGAPNVTPPATTDSNATAVAGITNPAIAAQYKASLDTLDQGITEAQTNLTAAQATVQNDPAAAAAVQGIQDKYDQQIQLMKAKNDQIIGRANTSVAAFGGLGVMSQTFLSDEQARADQRISNLVEQEKNLILKAQIAYKTNDVKALNTAMDAYNKANADKLKAINDLSNATNKQVTQMQTQQKIDAAAQKQAVTLDIQKSANLGTAIAANITGSGITDPQQISDYVASIAEEYGITNPDILKSAVDKAMGAATKAADTHQNVQSEIQKRSQPSTKGNGTDGTYKYTADDIAAYSALLNEGGKDPQGNTYAKRGSDGYTDPSAYIAALNDWTQNGGTPAGFAKKFPVKSNINSASYNLLPEAIRPKAPAASTLQVPPP